MERPMAKAKTKKSDPFVEFVLEQLQGIDRLECRRMFGGHGLYAGEKFFAILHKGQLFFKVTEKTRPDYERRGSGPFVASPKQIIKSYYEVPSDVLENRATLNEWAQRAISA